jgi:hypothetical protein
MSPTATSEGNVMAVDTELDLYETAFLCGGPQRVAMVALVALCEDGRAEIHPAGHRVGAVRRESDDAVEAAALEAIPESGRHLGYTMSVIARSPAVETIGEALRARGLLNRRMTSSLRGRSVRSGLTAAEGLRRVAIEGTSGIEDVRLRNLFAIEDAGEVHDPRSGRPFTGAADQPVDSGLGWSGSPTGGDSGGHSGGF